MWKMKQKILVKLQAQNPRKLQQRQNKILFMSNSKTNQPLTSKDKQTEQLKTKYNN